MGLALSFVGLGCQGRESTPDPVPAPAPAVVSVDCQLHSDNALRATCEVDVEPNGPGVLKLTPPGGEALEFEFVDGELEVWGLIPDAVHVVTASASASPAVEASTTLRAGPVLAGPTGTLLVDGADHATRFVLFDLECDTWGLWILDDQGRLRWFESFADEGAPGVLGYEWTEDGTLLALVGQQTIIELTLAGDVLWTARRTGSASAALPAPVAEFPGPVHHDVTRRNGYTYALTALEDSALGISLVWDGFEVFGPDGARVASWDARGAFEPQWGNPGCCSDYWQDWWPDAVDFAHSNALAVDDELNAYIGYRYVDTIQKVVADPESPEFGSVLWTLTGDPTSPVDDDFVLTSSLGATEELSFGSQHHVQAVSGGLRLFDNRWDGRLDSRVLEFALDPAAGTADVVRSASVGARCPIMGSAFELENGNWLVDCGPERTFTELVPETGEVVWQMKVSCPAETRRPPYRAVPLNLTRAER